MSVRPKPVWREGYTPRGGPVEQLSLVARAVAVGQKQVHSGLSLKVPRRGRHVLVRNSRALQIDCVKLRLAGTDPGALPWAGVSGLKFKGCLQNFLVDWRLPGITATPKDCQGAVQAQQRGTQRSGQPLKLVTLGSRWPLHGEHPGARHNRPTLSQARPNKCPDSLAIGAGKSADR